MAKVGLDVMEHGTVPVGGVNGHGFIYA